MAQSDRGAITGTVQDPAGAVVPDATIVARNTKNGSVFQTVTTPTGNFTIASMPVGTYDLTLEAPGFKKVTQEGVRVQVAQVLRLDFALLVGATAESITVTAEAPLLKTENGEQSVNVSGDLINELPLNFGGGGGAGGNIRSWTAFALLSPGVTGNNQNTRVNGSPGGNFKIIVEGLDVTSANDTTWTSTVSQASVEMIEEFSLQTSNYSAEFGQVAGGLFNFTTRSGTDLCPYAIGPRLGAAYQLDSKTVARGGIGVIYGNLGGYAYLTNHAILGWDSIRRSGIVPRPASQPLFCGTDWYTIARNSTRQRSIRAFGPPQARSSSRL